MVTADSPNTVRRFQLAAAKHAIALEAKGMRHSRFRKGVRGLWAEYYGMPKRSTHLAVIERIQEEIDTLTAAAKQMELPL